MLVTIRCEECGRSFLEIGRLSWQCLVRQPGFFRRLLGMGPRYVPIPVPTVPGVLDRLLPVELRGSNLLDLMRKGQIKTMGRCWCLNCSRGFDALLDDPRNGGPNCAVCGERGIPLGEMIDKPCPNCETGTVRRAVVAVI